MIQKKGSETMIEITSENRKQVLDNFAQRGYTNLISNIMEYVKINEDEYPEGSEWGTDKGYGARFFLIKSVKELVEFKLKFGINYGIYEHEAIINDVGGVSIVSLFLISAESSIILIQMDND